MITENLSTLKIHKLSREQYERELAAGRIDETALYLTPDEELDLSGYATKEDLAGKSDVSHTHDDIYYTEAEVDAVVDTINESIDNIKDGTTPVAKATSATKASQDDNGNVITETYETKADAAENLTKAIDDVKVELANQDAVVLSEAQAYADGKDAAIQEAKKAGDDAQADITAYKASNDEALAGVKATAEAAATKEYTDAELGKKVDAVEGKDLIATSEIERLATLKNYDDTALAGRVSTAEGKITDLEAASATHATKDEAKGYADAKDEAIAAAQKAADDITAYVGTFTHATAKTVVDYVNAKTDGIATSGNLEALAGRVTAVEGDVATIKGDYVKAADIANFETKENVKKVADDLAAETKARTDADAGFETRIAALEGNFGDGEGTVEAQIAAAVAVEKQRAEGIEGGLRTDVNAVAGRMTTAEGKITALETESAKHAIKTEVDNALALKADKSVVDAMYTNDAIDTAVQGAKDYAKGLVDAIPAQTDYTVKITENTDDATVAKTYVFSQCGAEIGSIKLAKELVVTAGSVKEATEADVPYTGAKVGDKYIELVIANQDAPIYVPAKDLVDIYTAKDGAAEVQVAISNTNEISATLVNGGITEAKLHADVATKLNKTWEEVGVAKGLVDALADGQVKTNKEAIENITKTDGLIAAAEQRAKDYADGLAGNYAEAEHDHVVANITDFESAVATKVESYGYATTTYADQAEADAKAYADAEVAKDRARLDVLEAIDHDAYIAADTTLKGEIIGTAGDASTANTINGAKKHAEEMADAAKTAAIADAAEKYEEKGVAQNIVNALNLSGTYEPIGAETRAIAAAKTETENQVKALADTVYTKTETYTKSEVDALLTWGSF